MDLPGDAEAALGRYEAALRAEGFETWPGEARGAGSLRVIDAATRAAAELTFFARETATRVEILFCQPSVG